MIGHCHKAPAGENESQVKSEGLYVFVIKTDNTYQRGSFVWSPATTIRLISIIYRRQLNVSVRMTHPEQF